MRLLDNKLKHIGFDDEIDLYWDKVLDLEQEVFYEILLNGETVGVSDFTHFELYGLEENTRYSIQVISKDKTSKEICTTYEEIKISTTAKKQSIDITLPPYNAVGDGKTDDTESIQKALDNCKSNQRVVIPKGVFLCGALNMPSDTELYIEKDGVLQGTAEREKYLPKRISRFEGYALNRYSALINVGAYDDSGKINARNIIIRGQGEIRGGGLELANNVVDYESQEMQAYMRSLGDEIKSYDNEKVIPGRLRPFLIDVNNCKNLVVSGLKIGNGSAWNVHFTYSKNVVVSRCDVVSSEIWNGDGIDPDSSEDIVIYDVKLDTGDDGIAIKSGKNPEGNIVNIPCRNIRIFHIQAKQGIAIGSELSGGVENVYVWDVEIENSSRGIRIKTTAERGGHVRNCYFSNIRCPYVALTTNYTCNNDGSAAQTLTKMENFYFENVVVRCQVGKYNYVSGFEIQGFDEAEYHVKKVTVKNLKLSPMNDKRRGKIFFKNVDDLQIEADLSFKEEQINNKEM